MQPKDQIQTVYVPYQNSDMTEGRGPMVPCNFGFSDRRTAEVYIDSQPGVMGRRGKWSAMKHWDWEVRELPIYSSLQEEAMDRKRLIRERTLANLSDEERDALGL